MKRKILVVVAVVFYSTLQAQTETLNENLEKVTVTATRFPKKISETGKVVTIITSEDLEKAGGKDVSQILNEQAGLIVNGSNTNREKIRVCI
ncbi:hypothetical protein [Niabella ginsengisoli]|uniref:TonB-dependent receptor plug domain-containing protein n=1 Tax=Niabella ginsengisoli TaxID=522298 RepID=A0ABS9SE56_9BACT|nr:hypothetical protein [Niabella ginsengisoli]MCH5596640.1 hypothetical protein [Niabella ginsengisoli]